MYLIMKIKHASLLGLFYMLQLAEAAILRQNFLGIEDGSRARIKDIPYQVAILYKGDLICSGVIISDQFILTAASCIPYARLNSGDMHVLVGTSDLNQVNARIYLVGKVKRHERFIFSLFDYDIGLLRLSKPMDFNERVQVALLADSGPIFRSGMTFTVSGWGYTSVLVPSVSRYLLKSDVIWMDQSTCQEKYLTWNITLNYRQFCSEMGSGPCMYDYGGPVVNDGTVVGVISGASIYCERYPPIYTKVSVYKDWISDTMKLLDQDT